jgi:two-component system sensor histidine kinase RegB
MAQTSSCLRQQTERCRTILRTLTSLESGLAPFDRIHAFASRSRKSSRRCAIFDTDFEIRYARGPQHANRWSASNPAILYGLESIVENAADFAKQKVVIEASWDEGEVNIAVADDGPGFAPEILGRIGEPYLRARGQSLLRKGKGEEEGGLGLGFFIAKTLLERGVAARCGWKIGRRR